MDKVLLVVMDGVGERVDRYGNAVAKAFTPNLDFLRHHAFFTTLKAHGRAVGLPSDNDIGNSEVGHNALGAGRIFEQGASLVSKAIENGQLFSSSTWNDMVNRCKANQSAFHLIGLLSDGNVHSHQDHLFAMIRELVDQKVPNIFVHALLDGRDVRDGTAETYLAQLDKFISSLQSSSSKIMLASGGGRMKITMDRYEADWDMVKRGWETHVLGEAEFRFKNWQEAFLEFRQKGITSDQYIPSFVICEDGKAVGKILDGDSVVFFNFRGDRAIEISRAFTEKTFSFFDRKRVPDVHYAGMMQYDGDLKIPTNYLVNPPLIEDTLGEYMCELGVRQFACSETQKFGHVTYFWNGNRSGKFSDVLETYIEVPSDNIEFNLKPWMKAFEITEVCANAIGKDISDFYRVNFANGDMVGHTGDFLASVIAVETVDMMIGKLMDVCRQHSMYLVVTADHGNCDDMFEKDNLKSDQWETHYLDHKPKAKTAHSLSEVPFYVFHPDTKKQSELRLNHVNGVKFGLANVAQTILKLMGLKMRPDLYLPSIIA